MRVRILFTSLVLILLVAGAAAALVAWKYAAMGAAAEQAASHPEPAEAITVAVAAEKPHHRTVTAIGTIRALRSVTLRNELAGTVHEAALASGAIVAEGTVLVALDVAVEEAELKVATAQAALAASTLDRMTRAQTNRAASEMEVDRARADRDVALAHIRRAEAVIARKTIRAPFRARIGLADVHRGQYLSAGTELTTLQGVDDAVHVDFAVAQVVAAGLRIGSIVHIALVTDGPPSPAEVVAIDSRIDPATRNATLRARVSTAGASASPGASVRVRVPVGAETTSVVVPVTSLRRGPTGDHVFVIMPDPDGRLRAHARTVTGGTMLGDEIVVREGLAAGEQVAADGAFKLREGVLVTVPSAEPAGAAAPHAK